MSMKKLTTHHNRKTPLTREKKRRRQRLAANLEGLCVIAALLGLGAVIGAGLRGGLR